MATTKDIKFKKFKKLIFKDFGQHQSYDKILHRLLESRQHMLKHSAFRKSSAENQLLMLTTIDLMVTHTQLAQLNRTMPLSKPKDVEYKYDIERGFRKPTLIDVDDQPQMLESSNSIMCEADPRIAEHHMNMQNNEF